MLAAEMCEQSTLCSVVREGVVDSDPEVISALVRSNAPVRIGLEIGPPATWLSTQLKRLGLPVICIDARRAKRRIKQTGWFEEISVKDLDGHSVRALLASLALLVKIKRDLANQIRGLLKNLGLAIGRPESTSSRREPRS